MVLEKIYKPIEKELTSVEEVLENSLKNSGNEFLSEMSGYLMETKGKRLRPALVLFSAKATRPEQVDNFQAVNIAAAVELIHMASLVHDDVIDMADTRHNRSTFNSKWGQDVSITFGDYLYSIAFGLISSCGSLDIVSCMSLAAKAMCEGEFLQVCERENLELLKERYILIVKKKTAALFAASCQAGTLVTNSRKTLQKTLNEYGMNFGIAFQISDDYLDIVCEEEELGKMPGQDIDSGELTLPLLNLIESVPDDEKNEFKKILTSKKSKESLKKVKSRLINSGAALKTKRSAFSYVASAKDKIEILPESQYKESLLSLADFVIERGFDRAD